MSKKLEKAFAILGYAIQNKISLPKACEKYGEKRNFVSNIKLTIEQEVKAGNVSQEEWEIFSGLYAQWDEINNGNSSYNSPDTFSGEINLDEEIKNIQNSVVESFDDENFDPLSVAGYEEEEEEEERIFMADYDGEQDDAYDERSTSEIIRDEADKIVKYTYRVKVRGQEDLVGEFSREEMDKVYRLYSSMDGAGLTQRAVVREFPHLDLRDFRRVLRAFNITKQSIPVAPHIIEENSVEKVKDIVFRNKENNIFRRLEDDRRKHFENEYKRAVAELQKERSKKTGVSQSLIQAIKELNFSPFRIEQKTINNEVALMVYLADMHIGAHNNPNTALFSGAYNPEVYNERLTSVLNKIAEFGKIYQRFDALYICNLGDNLDGMNGQTTRGGHGLPQNLDNRMQFKTYLDSMIRFFGTIHQMNVANNIHFISVGDCNHAGDFGYTSNLALKYLFEEKFPDVKFVLFEKFIEHFEYGQHCFILTHGKDKQHMKHGFKLNLNDKLEVYFNNYIDQKKINRGLNISVVKADLHVNNSQLGKFFRYRNAMSLFGGSEWIDTNFGFTKPGVSFDIVFKNESQIMEGWIEV